MKCLFLLIILLSGPALGAEVACEWLQRADFKEAVEGLRELKQPLSFLSAAVLVQMVNPETDKTYAACSGSFISDDGIVLTASHCLDQCRFEKGGQPKNVSTCRLKLNGVMQDVEVIKASSCSFHDKSTYLYNKWQGLDNSSFPPHCEGDEMDDYAILKPADAKPLGEFACLPLANHMAPLGSDVFTMGRPGQTFRGQTVKDSLDAPGKQLMVSTGKIVNQKTCEKYSQATGLMGYIYGRKKIPENMNLPDDAGYGVMVQTTVDAVHGNSGGPLITSSGEIVGNYSFSFVGVNDFYQECRGATFFQPVTQLPAEIKSKIGSCQKRRASQGSEI